MKNFFILHNWAKYHPYIQYADISQGEVVPRPKVQSREEIIKFVEAEAWGHHASCSNKMGLKNYPMAVVDSEFRVPGYFIVTPIYIN